ncbi:RNA recognition motif domain-containing protein [Leptospira vanthielii]|uniref:RNA-binding protein n=1 Tax=Leptospira vanthielii TaxID=293085 RepID=A0ABY2NM13_9LEPT|nr:RNA-binding protein [Leptospira vanthielii]TGM51455.1 RNA-binding protein [Leptospira vanthielii]
MVSNKIYVGNLKFSLKEENIRQIFSVYGVIQDLKMIHDRETGNFRGFAFITYANPDEAEEAVTQMNGQPVDGRNLKVTFAEDKRKEKQN